MSVSDDGDGGELESTIDHFVGEVLHAADLDGDGLLVLPQRNLRANIGKLVVTTRPDFVVRDMMVDPMVDVVIHDSKVPRDGDLSWAQIGGEMLIAALRSAVKTGMGEGTVHMAGIRTLGTRFTFFKGAFDAAALHRLSLARPKPIDSFLIHCWGGDFVDRANQTRDVYWGLDFRVHSERKQLMLMITALGKEIRARQRSGA